MTHGEGCPKHPVSGYLRAMGRPGSVQEIHSDALMAQVQLGQWLLSLGSLGQLLQLWAVQQEVQQSKCDMCQMDGHEVVVYHGITMPQMFIEVCDINHESVLRGREHQQLVPVAKVLECLLLTLVNSACVVLEPSWSLAWEALQIWESGT